jgi:hypothetical protein
MSATCRYEFHYPGQESASRPRTPFRANDPPGGPRKAHFPSGDDAGTNGPAPEYMSRLGDFL